MSAPQKRPTLEDLNNMKHSALLRLAASDCRSLAFYPGVRFCLSTFFSTGPDCYVCAAGAVAYNSFGARERRDWNALAYVFRCDDGVCDLETCFETISHYAMATQKGVAHSCKARELVGTIAAKYNYERRVDDPAFCADYLDEVAAVLESIGE